MSRSSRRASALAAVACAATFACVVAPLSAPATASSAGRSTATTASTRAHIWHPSSHHAASFQWVLGGRLSLHSRSDLGTVDIAGRSQARPKVYDLDGDETPASTVRKLHARGAKVVCYLDAGVYEAYRPDAAKFRAIAPRVWGKADAYGGPNGGGWADSYWLDIRRIDALAPIMKARIHTCRTKGFDAVEPDEIDGYANDSGFPLTYRDQLRYNRHLASWAHTAGLSVGQKGDIDQSKDLVTSFDWTLNEECYMYSECSLLRPYVRAGKAAWIAEYPEETTSNGGEWAPGVTKTITYLGHHKRVFKKAKFASLCSNARAHHYNLSEYVLGLPHGAAGGAKHCAKRW